MKISKIIKGLRYSTEAAEKVYEISCQFGRSDFHWEETSLYLSKKGQWFLAGAGNAMSRWAARAGDSVTSGVGLKPISPADAQEILEEEDQDKLLEKYFTIREG